jgi:hypothetical protein
LATAALPGLPRTRARIKEFAERNNWTSCEIPGKGLRGGRRIAWHLTNLTEAQQAALIQFEQNRSLSAAAASPGSAASSSAGSFPAAAADSSIATPGDVEYEHIREALWADFDRASEDLKQRATEDTKVALHAQGLMAEGYPKLHLISIAAREFRRGASTIRGWFDRDLKGIKPEDFAAALLDLRGRRGPSLPTYDPFIYEFYKSDYLRTDRPPRAACYRRAVEAANARGISENQIPSEITLWRRLVREAPWQAIKGARYGKQALHRTYPSQTRDRSILHALEAIDGDGYRFNLAVRWPDGEVCRPLMWYWQDIYSGMILSWRHDRSENAGLLRLTIGDLISQYRRIPRYIVIDNTLAAASKWITGQSPSRHRWRAKSDDVFGLITQLGAQHIATLPRVGGSSKPGERAGGDWDRDIARHPALAGAWLGYKPEARPEDAREPVPFEIFRQIVEQEMAKHNARRGRRTPVCKGRSFREVFDESLARVPENAPTREQLRLCMLAAEKVTCHKIDGHIELYKNKYWSETTAQLAGQQVVVRFDPEELQKEIYVYSLEGRGIGEAQCRAPVGFLDTAAGQEHGRRRRQNLKMHRAIAANQRSMSALELASALPQMPENNLPVITNNVRQLFHSKLEQPHPGAMLNPDQAGAAASHNPERDLPEADYEFWRKADNGDV